MKQTSFFEIGLDFRMARHTGIGTYLCGLTQAMHRSNLLNPDQFACFGRESGSRQDESHVYFDARIYTLEEQLRYPEFLARCRLWHAPHYNIPFFKGKTKLIVTIHDLIHWVYRKSLNPVQRLYAEVMLRRAVAHADHILTVSEHSKNDLVKYLNAKPEKITVIYNGIDPDFYPVDPVDAENVRLALRQKYNIENRFFLYVGMLKEHKNVSRLLRVFLNLKKQKKIENDLVIIGQGGINSPEVKVLRDAGPAVTHLPKIQFGDLRLFYQAATALIHPSLYEGFGLTVAEAMACGTPVLTTRRASLPEVAGDAAVFMDGEDENEFAEKMKQMDEDQPLRERLSRQGPLRACRFSWDKAARETVEVYKRELSR